MKIKQCEKFQIKPKGGCQCMSQFDEILPIRIGFIFNKNNQWYGIYYKEGDETWSKTRKLSGSFALRAIHCYKGTRAYYKEINKFDYYEIVMLEKTHKEIV